MSIVNIIQNFLMIKGKLHIGSWRSCLLSRTKQNEDDVVIGDQLADALDLIQNIVSANLEDERVKATRHFVKKILNAKTKLETMINLLHGIGNKVAAPKKNGKKMKKGKLIPVQTTAKSRRDNPHPSQWSWSKY